MRKKVKIVIVVGARPNFMKIAPIMRAMKKANQFQVRLVHTGQHYDEMMSGRFFEDLKIPKPHIHLGIGSAPHGEQTGKIMGALEPILVQERPDWVLVVGDVNSTLAAALVASKLQIKIAHVEAGMRSFDKTMPEEINRVLTDRISDLLFTTCPEEDKNLMCEGISRKQIICAGDVMIDNLYYELHRLKTNSKIKSFAKHDRYAVLTLHRPSNVDNKKNFLEIISAVNEISTKIPVYFPIHPRTKKNIDKFKIRFSSNVHCLSPLNYKEFLTLSKKAQFVMTDSGGIQIETSVLNIPCLTLRDTTERLMTVKKGTNILVGSDAKAILREARKILKCHKKRSSLVQMWDGRASDRIVQAILKDSKHSLSKGKK